MSKTLWPLTWHDFSSQAPDASVTFFLFSLWLIFPDVWSEQREEIKHLDSSKTKGIKSFIFAFKYHFTPMMSNHSSLERRIFLFVGVNEAGFLLESSGSTSPPSGFCSVWIFRSGLKEGPIEENLVNLRFLALSAAPAEDPPSLCCSDLDGLNRADSQAAIRAPPDFIWN